MTKNCSPRHPGQHTGVKFAPEQRAFVGRVISRLRAAPYRMQLQDAATLLGISKNWAMKMCNEARGLCG